MSIEELERAWHEQSGAPVNQPAAERHVARMRQSIVGGTTFAIVALVLAFGNLVLKLHRLATDERFTLVNSSWDLAIAVAVVAGSGIGLLQALRLRRELRALTADTLACLDLLIRQVRGEIRSFRRDMPVVFVVCAVLLVLAKAQSISAGLESPAEWLLIGLVVGGMIVAGVMMQHRATVWLAPRLVLLEAARRELAADRPDAA